MTVDWPKSGLSSLKNGVLVVYSMETILRSSTGIDSTVLPVQLYFKYFRLPVRLLYGGHSQGQIQTSVIGPTGLKSSSLEKKPRPNGFYPLRGFIIL